ncbi:hypothetical protein E2C01_015014 [Portunus trituberculatus]|uniref:Uncharacterized protein n=1 Tax=Portunus trituberculatus TaxID=210409 RepID=A0A5B7DLP5_PORTR|nr:hypothetical protein [Portunus trituberculatus]
MRLKKASDEHTRFTNTTLSETGCHLGMQDTDQFGAARFIGLTNIDKLSSTSVSCHLFFATIAFAAYNTS